LKYIFSLFLIYLQCQINIYAADTDSSKYFPLSVGNKYIYNEYQQGYNVNLVSETTKDTLFNSRKYFFVTNNPRFGTGWVRVDDVTGSLYIYDTSGYCQLYEHEKMVDSLDAKAGSLITNCDAYCRCIGDITDTLFQNKYISKKFEYDYTLSKNYWGYSKGIGLSYYSYVFDSPVYVYKHEYRLTGCVIYGVVYGDTSIAIGITKIGDSIPSEFFLYQNYPNPFSSKTKIKYDLARECIVSIKVFDSENNLIPELVNRKQKPGTYQTEFDASDLPAGDYTYQLEVFYTNGDSERRFADSKMMVLIK
jgi:hypothetical protein